MKSKIIAWLQEELESSRQIIAEYTDEKVSPIHRRKDMDLL